MILTDKTKFDAYAFNLLLHKIKNTKSQYDTDLAKEDTLKGYRYNDDERIARMVIGKIYAEVGFDHVKANDKFISLNSIEIEPYIRYAVIDSASSDYHYMYVKEW